jgi:hypothetical protein
MNRSAQVDRVYVMINGSGFDAREFQKQFGATLGGKVKRYKRPPPNSSLEYWESRIVKVPAAPGPFQEDVMFEFLQAMSEPLKRLRNCPNIRVEAVASHFFKDATEVHGIHISTKLVNLLFELGVSLDFSVNRVLPSVRPRSRVPRR